MTVSSLGIVSFSKKPYWSLTICFWLATIPCKLKNTVVEGWSVTTSVGHGKLVGLLPKRSQMKVILKSSRFIQSFYSLEGEWLTTHHQSGELRTFKDMLDEVKAQLDSEFAKLSGGVKNTVSKSGIWEAQCQSQRSVQNLSVSLKLCWLDSSLMMLSTHSSGQRMLIVIRTHLQRFSTQYCLALWNITGARQYISLTKLTSLTPSDSFWIHQQTWTELSDARCWLHCLVQGKSDRQTFQEPCTGHAISDIQPCPMNGSWKVDCHWGTHCPSVAHRNWKYWRIFGT